MQQHANRLWETDEVLSRNGGPLPMSRGGVYKAISEGIIPSVRIGRRVFIPNWYIEKITGHPAEEISEGRTRT